jgi:threonine synthase
MTQLQIKCINCGRSYPETGAPYRCPKCTGLYDFAGPLKYDPAQVDRSRPGIWKYRHTFGFPDNAPDLSIGEGNTPLLWAEAFGRQIAFKCEYQNPSGSFKDRGSATLVSALVARNVIEAVEDSSGNAGASFAAYAARAGIKARVFVPESASGPKRQQIEMYGAELIPVPGPRSNAGEAVRRVADEGTVYASHAYLPFNIPGYATAAYEVWEQLGTAPGALIVPAGQGGLLLGMARGFDALKSAGLIKQTPKLIGVQAQACAPYFALVKFGPSGMHWIEESPTLAEGVCVRVPLRVTTVLEAVERSGGEFVAVPEEKILAGRDQLANRGLYVEPTSALVWDALAQTLAGLPDPVVAVLTGSGYKYRG